VETLCRFKDQGNFNKEAFEEVSEHIDKNNKNEDVSEAQPVSDIYMKTEVSGEVSEHLDNNM
jgi:hypothetical protein